MSGRIEEMCDFCKFDKICNYNCIKLKNGYRRNLFVCPNFIYDNGKTITNAEYISTLLKTDIDDAAYRLWAKTVSDSGNIDISDFKSWLNKTWL